MNKKITTGDAISLYEALESFSQKDLKISSTLAWAIEDNTESLKRIVEKFERFRNNARKRLVDMDAFYQEEGSMKIKPEYESAFREEDDKLKELLRIENDVEIFTIERKDVPEVITMSDLRALKFMIYAKEDDG